MSSSATLVGSDKGVDQPEELQYEERLAFYNYGGYHPVTLGDVLDDRYRIHCKLGWGSYATVWLAEDEEFA